MKERPSVSIITPTYNHEKYIAECIESVLAQSYPYWEQIFIDDGSSDRTCDIINQYKDERVKYIRQENKGIWRLGETYNKALQLAKGKYIAILEGDDFWPPDKLELQLMALEDTGATLCWGKAKIVDHRGDVLEVFPKGIDHFMGLTKEQMLGELLFENPIASCTVVCRKSALLSIGGFKQPPGLPYVDEPTWLQLCLLGGFLPLNEILGCYRRHERQVTSSMKASMIKASRYSIDFFRSQPEEIKASVAGSFEGLYTKLDRKEKEYYYYAGRANMLEGEYGEANENFLRALFMGHPVLKAKAVIGIISNLCRVDMAWLDALAKRLK